MTTFVMTSLSKWGAALALGVAVFCLVTNAYSDRAFLPRRVWDAYTRFLDRKLNVLSSGMSGAQVAVLQVLAGALLGVIQLFTEIPYWYVAAGLIMAAPALQLEERLRQRSTSIERQLDPFILSLANALKSTPSVNLAFQSVADTTASPMREELERCNRELRVGSTLEEVVLRLSARVGSTRLDSVLTALILGRKVGGNLPQTLENTASSIREMVRLEGVLRTKTAEAKMQLYVLAAAPAALILGMSLVSPGYFDPLQQSTLGYTIGLGAVASWVIAIVAARKVLAVAL